jgi:hypothetical protein
LAPVTTSDLPTKPVSGKQREEFKVRMIGAGLAGVAICFIVLNYFEIQCGMVYPKYLGVSPLLLVNGCILLAKPGLDLSSATSKRYCFALAVILSSAGGCLKTGC